MKYILFLILSVSVLACKNGQKEEEQINPQEITATTGMNTLVPDEEDGGEMFLGPINFEGLQNEPFKDWFELNYNEHQLHLW